MKTNLSLRAAFGIACMSMMFTACTKEDQVLPADMIPAITDNHSESRIRGFEDREKATSIHFGLDATIAGEIRGEEGKLYTKRPTTVCLQCDPERDGHYLEIKENGAR